MTTASSSSDSKFLPLTPDPPQKTLSSKPSWIGKIPPPRSVISGSPAMKQEVRISYRSRGCRPPVYIVTSLSDPQWEPKELHSTVEDDGEIEFWRSFQAEEGEHQYKFRLGPGDWWALDETKTIVVDEDGNRNNVVVVKRPSQQAVRVSPDPSTQPIPRASMDSVHSTISDSGLKISNAETERPYNSPAMGSNRSSSQLAPDGTLTPPLTPDTWGRGSSDDGKFQPFPASGIQRPASVASHYSDQALEDAAPVEEKKQEDRVVALDGPAEPRRGLLAQMKLFVITIGTWMLAILGGGMRMTGILAIAMGIAAIIYKIRDLRNAMIPAILSFFYPSTYGQRRNGTDDPSMV